MTIVPDWRIWFIRSLNCIPETEAAEKAKVLLQRVGLENVDGKKTGKYSKGMRQRLGLADVLIKNPKSIFLMSQRPVSILRGQVFSRFDSRIA
jgi:ABC-type proline/glycine betaine transport system ATPase subunit